MPRIKSHLLTLLLLGATTCFVGCGTASQNPAAPSNAGALTDEHVASSAASALPMAAGAQTSAEICHRTGADQFVHLSVASTAVDAHLKHGDGLVGGPVPEHPGMTFDASCTPVQAITRVTITFAVLSGDGSPFTTYTESGVTVVPTQGSWQISTGYRNPAPFIQFETPAASPITTATVTVTAGADFRFSSVDVYSSITPIPYTFTGMKDGATVYGQRHRTQYLRQLRDGAEPECRHSDRHARDQLVESSEPVLPESDGARQHRGRRVTRAGNEEAWAASSTECKRNSSGVQKVQH